MKMYSTFAVRDFSVCHVAHKRTKNLGNHQLSTRLGFLQAWSFFRLFQRSQQTCSPITHPIPTTPPSPLRVFGPFCESLITPREPHYHLGNIFITRSKLWVAPHQKRPAAYKTIITWLCPMQDYYNLALATSLWFLF